LGRKKNLIKILFARMPPRTTNEPKKTEKPSGGHSKRRKKNIKEVRISQQQIARDLGVSQTLVSMVLNGRRKGVSEEAFHKIWDHARTSGYRPKGIAPEFLVTRPTTKSAGLMLRAGVRLYSQSRFFGHVQHGIHEYLAEQGIALVFLGAENDIDVEALKRLRDPEEFLGLLICGEVARPFLQALLKLDLRVISISGQYPGLCNSVVSNEEQAADLMVQHLMELGHTTFAYVGGNRGMQTANSRLRAVKSALHLRDIEIDPKYCIYDDSGDRLEGSRVAEEILKVAGSKRPPTAWICFNGVMARGVISSLTKNGLKVPGDISVCAFDRTRICEEELPTLTGAHTSPEMMGRVAAELLLQGVGKDQARFMDTVLPAEIFYGDSTGSAPAKR
jgi:LacI family transcriptional regulator